MQFGDEGGDVVLVPADAFVFDRVFEAVLVVIESGCSGFHFDEDDFEDWRSACVLSSSFMFGFACNSVLTKGG